MSDIRREILEELTRVRLDKTRLYTLLLKIVDSCGCCAEASPAPAPVKAEPVKVEEPVKAEPAPAPVEAKPKAKPATKKATTKTTTKKTTTKKAAASTSS